MVQPEAKRQTYQEYQADAATAGFVTTPLTEEQYAILYQLNLEPWAFSVGCDVAAGAGTFEEILWDLRSPRTDT